MKSAKERAGEGCVGYTLTLNKQANGHQYDIMWGNRRVKTICDTAGGDLNASARDDIPLSSHIFIKIHSPVVFPFPPNACPLFTSPAFATLVRLVDTGIHTSASPPIVHDPPLILIPRLFRPSPNAVYRESIS